MSLKKFSILTLALSTVIAASACEKEAVQTNTAPAPVAVTTTTAVAIDVPFSASYIGKITAYDNVGLLPRVQGFLKARKFHEGDFVKKGQVLFLIEDDNYKAALQQANANLASAEANAINASVQFERAKELIQTGDISRSLFDTREAAALAAEAAVKAARAAVTTASLNLSYTEIKAPFAGRIGMAAYSEGEYISAASGPLATLISTDPIGVTFSISAQSLAKISDMGDEKPKVYATITNSENKVYDQIGKLDFVDNMVNQQTDTLKIRAKFANPKQELIDGEIVNVRITTEEDFPAVIIPQAAMQQDQAGRYVMVVNKDNKVILTRITTGREISSFIIVEKGLNAGEQIVLEGLQRVKQDTLVKPTLQAPAVPSEDEIDGNIKPAKATEAKEATDSAKSNATNAASTKK